MQNNTQKYIIGFVVIAILAGLFMAWENNRKPVEVYDDPEVEVADTTKKYEDMFVAKCYNEDEVEVKCKG